MPALVRTLVLPRANDGYCADSCHSWSTGWRSASRPFESSSTAICYVRFTSTPVIFEGGIFDLGDNTAEGSGPTRRRLHSGRFKSPVQDARSLSGAPGPRSANGKTQTPLRDGATGCPRVDFRRDLTRD